MLEIKSIAKKKKAGEESRRELNMIYSCQMKAKRCYSDLFN